jgi:hypothetical protein
MDIIPQQEKVTTRAEIQAGFVDPSQFGRIKVSVQSCKTLASMVHGTLTLGHSTLPEFFSVRIPESRRLSVNAP